MTAGCPAPVDVCCSRNKLGRIKMQDRAYCRAEAAACTWRYLASQTSSSMRVYACQYCYRNFMYGSNDENVNWNMGINKKQASRKWRTETEEAVGITRYWRPLLTYQGSSGTIQLQLFQAEPDCPPSTPLNSNSTTHQPRHHGQ